MTHRCVVRPAYACDWSPPSRAAASASPSPTPSPAAETEPVVLFEVKPVPGKPLTTTLNVGLQKLAEKTLASTQASQCLGCNPSVDRRHRCGRKR